MSWEYQKAVLKTPLKGKDRDILIALCDHREAPDKRFRWALESIATAADCCVRTVRMRLPKLVEAGYLTRQTTGHDAYEFTITNPANWPAKPTVAMMRAARIAGRQRMPGGRQELPPIPVLTPSISNEILSPLAGQGPVETLVLESVSAKPQAPVRPRSKIVTDEFIRHLCRLWNRHAARPDGAAKAPHYLAGVDAEAKIAAGRRTAIEARVRENPAFADPKNWGVLIRAIAANDMCNGGENRRRGQDGGWKATFDFMVAKSKFDRLVHGDGYAWAQRPFDGEPDPADEPERDAAGSAAPVARTIATPGGLRAVH